MCINFRLATIKDCDLLFKWVNDKEVRKNAFNNKIIKYDDHKAWFNEKINSHTTKIFIASKYEDPIGQIRIDINGDLGIIDYSIAREFRRKGYGIKLLTENISEVKNYNLDITKLVGKVKHTNIASQKAFTKAGYKEQYKVNYIEYTKILL